MIFPDLVVTYPKKELSQLIIRIMISIKIKFVYLKFSYVRNITWKEKVTRILVAH